MAQTPKSLADGQLPNAAGDLYTVPADTATYLGGFTLYNDNAAEQTITLYLQRGGSNRKVYHVVLAQNETVWGDFKGIILSTGDKLRGVTTTASAVDYFLSGVEEDV